MYIQSSHRCWGHAGVYDQDFIAANQSDRADNIVKGSKKEQMETIRQQIRDFKQANEVDKVIVLWTANTERYASVIEGLNDNAENFLASIDKHEAEVGCLNRSQQTIDALMSMDLPMLAVWLCCDIWALAWCESCL